MTPRPVLFGALLIIGAGWGATQPLIKIAVSDGYRHFGLIFWQFVIAGAILTLINLIRRVGLPLGWPQIRLYVFIACIGTLFPNSSSFEAARYLPAGVMAILISTVPMFAFPIAMALGNERFEWRRLGGLTLGLLGIILLMAPDASLPERAMIAFIPLALIAPAFYGLEGNAVARWGTFGCDAFQVLQGSAFAGILLSLPLAIGSGFWITPSLPLGAPDWALIISSIIHAFAYTGYVWLVGAGGSVFAAQVAYLVTAFGLIWSMIVLNESYSGWVWLALALVLSGVALVQPRARNVLEGRGALGEDGV